MVFRNQFTFFRDKWTTFSSQNFFSDVNALLFRNQGTGLFSHILAAFNSDNLTAGRLHLTAGIFENFMAAVFGNLLTISYRCCGATFKGNFGAGGSCYIGADFPRDLLTVLSRSHLAVDNWHLLTASFSRCIVSIQLSIGWN